MTFYDYVNDNYVGTYRYTEWMKSFIESNRKHITTLDEAECLFKDICNVWGENLTKARQFMAMSGKSRLCILVVNGFFLSPMLHRRITTLLDDYYLLEDNKPKTLFGKCWKIEL